MVVLCQNASPYWHWVRSIGYEIIQKPNTSKAKNSNKSLIYEEMERKKLKLTSVTLKNEEANPL